MIVAFIYSFIYCLRVLGPDQASAEGAELCNLLDEARRKSGAVESERAQLQKTMQHLETKLEMERKRMADAESRIGQLETSNIDLHKNGLEMHRERAQLQKTMQHVESKFEMERKRMVQAELRIGQLEAINADLQKNELEMHRDLVS